MDKDPKWLAFYGLLQAHTHLVDLVGSQMERETGLPPSWFEVLACLQDCPKRMSELAEEVTLSRGGATRLVARMEQAGLVEREVPAHDRRATYARLTPAGQDALERAMPVHLAAVQERFSRHIDDAQAAALRDAFAAILIGNGVDCAALSEAAAQVDAA